MARCSGELRAYVFIGEIAGFIICRFTLSRIIMKISGVIIKFIKRIISFLNVKIYQPLRRIANKLRLKISVNIKSLIDKLLNSVNNVKKGLKHRTALLYNQHIRKKNKQKTS